MCGILAQYNPNGPVLEPEMFRNLLDTLSHRGPDDSGIWSEASPGIILGHRRLSILDLSPLGHQPMFSHDERWAMVYNGEIYNFPELRKKLENQGTVFKGHSDTEILLESITTFGLETTLRESVGMFAWAVWDRRERRLWIARDRFGEKPLYYAWKNGAWWVASELKALAAIPGTSWDLDPQAVHLYLRYKYIPEPFSIYREAHKLPPGCFAELRADGTTDIRTYWNFIEVIERGKSQPFPGTEADAVSELDRLLRDAIQSQSVADVPVGAFLSGGIDSSTVVSLMQNVMGNRIRTFSIGFAEADYDESGYAKTVAQHIGTSHTELKVTPTEAMAVIPELSSIYDEPFGDSSAIPTILVSRLARRDVTVALSGDGGDEIFGGYTRFLQLHRLWEEIRADSAVKRNGLSFLYGLGRQICSGLGWERYAQSFAFRERYTKINSMPELYHGIITHYGSLDELMVNPPVSQDSLKPWALTSPFHYGMACDTVGYLPGDILVKVDRAAMSCSLESRIPILNHQIVEFAWTLPESYKIDPQNTKKTLRSVLQRYVPPTMFERPKKGFGVPVGEWIQGPLRDWAESLFSESSLKKTGILDVAKTRALWLAHRDRRVNDQFRVWPVLMLQAWLVKNQK